MQTKKISFFYGQNIETNSEEIEQWINELESNKNLGIEIDYKPLEDPRIWFSSLNDFLAFLKSFYLAKENDKFIYLVGLEEHTYINSSFEMFNDFVTILCKNSNNKQELNFYIMQFDSIEDAYNVAATLYEDYKIQDNNLN